MAAAKTKATPRKRSATKQAKPSPRKRTATPKAQPKRATKRTKAEPKRTVTRRPSRPELADQAKRATELVTVNSSGDTIARAPISSVKLGDVRDTVIGKRRPADVIVDVIAGPRDKERPGRVGVKRAPEVPKAALTIATQYAGAKIGQTDLPEGARARLSAAAQELGDPGVHKINGRAMAACLVALAESGSRKRSRR